MQANDTHTSLKTLVCMENLSQKFIQKFYEESGGHERIDFAIVQLQDRLMMIQGQVRVLFIEIRISFSLRIKPQFQSQPSKPNLAPKLNITPKWCTRQNCPAEPSRQPSRQGCRLGSNQVDSQVDRAVDLGALAGIFPPGPNWPKFPNSNLNLKSVFTLKFSENFVGP